MTLLSIELTGAGETVKARSSHQRPNGSWRVEMRWVDRTGREQRATRTTKTKADAGRALKELRALAETGGSAGERMITVDAYWQRWRAGPLRLRTARRRPSSCTPACMRTHALIAIARCAFPG